MKKHLFYIFLFVILASSAKAQFAFIPDTNFRNFLMNNGFAGCMQGDSLDTTCTAVTSATRINCSSKNLFSLTGIEYFDNLDTLICYNNYYLSTIPLLPSTISYIDCQLCGRLTSIQPLPVGLKYLDCYHDSLVTLPSLPDSLIFLQCDGNKLTTLPSLPANIQNIYCNFNQLTVLPVIPSSLKILAFNNNLVSNLPLLPNGLKVLGCSFNQLTYIPVLPDSLEILSCGHNQISNFSFLEFPSPLITLDCESNLLSQWPSVQSCLNLNYINCSHNQFTSTPFYINSPSFTYLDCSYNQITDFFNLWLTTSITDLNFSHNFIDSAFFPTNAILANLDCSYNQLTSLTWNNGTLQSLDCSHNLLDSLSGYYSSVSSLDCSYNLLTSLPSSYIGGSSLDCSHNQIIGLDILYGVYTLKCQVNQITSISSFRDSVYLAQIDSNPIACLPPVSTINTLTWANTNIHCLPNYGRIHFSTPLIDTLLLCQPSVNCPSMWNITGKVFFDADSSCTQDTGEIGLKNVPVVLDSSGIQLQEFLTDNLGRYSFRTGIGNYNLRIDTTNASFRVVCPSTFFEVAMLNIVDSMDTVPFFGLLCNYGFDLTAKSISPIQIFRPGFQNTIYLDAGEGMSFSGVSCSSAINGSVQAILNSLTNYISPAPGANTPTSINGDTITWNIPDFSLVDPVHDFNIIVEVSTSATINDSVCVQLNVFPTAGDNIPSNNSLSECFPIRSSFDPNEKYMSPSGLVDTSQQWFTFTIFFQNTGNAPAEDIYILDTLDQNLDATTFTYLSSSHEVITQLLPGNILRFNYPDINLIDSTTNEPGSHGYVQFKIKRKENLVINTTISNMAYIYFDFNAVVATNRVEATFASEVGVGDHALQSFTVYPNPAENKLAVDNRQYAIESIEVYNLLGEKIIKKLFSKGNKLETIDVDFLKRGIYFLKVQTEKVSAVRKFVKE